jgi:hypothetical protein
MGVCYRLTENGSDPMVYPAKDSYIILLAPDFILINIAEEDIREILTNIAEDNLYVKKLDQDNVIPIVSVHEIESNKKAKDVCILYKNDSGFKAESITMKDEATRDRFFEEIYAYIKNDYSYSVKEFSRLRATVAPLIGMGITIAGGILLAWVAHIFQTTPLKRTRIVKAWVAMVYEILKFLGPIPVLVITAIIFSHLSLLYSQEGS